MVAWWCTEVIAHYESHGKTLKTMNNTLENTTYIIDNKFFLCQHNKLHPLTARRGKWISETFHIDIENVIKNDSQKYITSEGGEDLLNRKFN